MHYSKIRGLMAERGINQEQIAKVLDISIVTFNQKINKKREFKVGELIALSSYFNISIDEVVK